MRDAFTPILLYEFHGCISVVFFTIHGASPIPTPKRNIRLLYIHIFHLFIPFFHTPNQPNIHPIEISDKDTVFRSVGSEGIHTLSCVQSQSFVNVPRKRKKNDINPYKERLLYAISHNAQSISMRVVNFTVNASPMITHARIIKGTDSFWEYSFSIQKSILKVMRYLLKEGLDQVSYLLLAEIYSLA